MSTMRDSPMAGQSSEGELWYSKSNVALAASQRLLQSWIPSNPSNQPTTEDDSDEEDFKDDGDTGGLGAVTKDDDSELDGILKRRRTDKDKLLERLIGKKAAEAHKKSQKSEPGKSMSASKHAAPKSITSTSSKLKHSSRPQESDDEDEEMGRAAAFTSKKTRDTKVPAYATAGGKADADVDPDAEPPDPREEVATVKEIVKQSEEEGAIPKKRKVGSYLDEVLGQRGKKGKKKMKGKGGGRG